VDSNGNVVTPGVYEYSSCEEVSDWVQISAPKVHAPKKRSSAHTGGDSVNKSASSSSVSKSSKLNSGAKGKPSRHRRG
jgi:hypothetical protein